MKQSQEKIKSAAKSMKNGKPTQEGIGFLYHFNGMKAEEAVEMSGIGNEQIK